MSFIFHNFFYRPLVNILALLTRILPGESFGVAIITLTVLVNLLFLPISIRMRRMQRHVQEIQPEIEKIKLQFKDKKDEQARRTLELYKARKIRPVSGVMLPVVIQLMLFIALYKVFQGGGGITVGDLYSFMPPIESLDPLFLNFIDLSKPSKVLAVLAGAAQFFQISLTAKNTGSAQPAKESFGASLQKNMKYSIPGVIIIAGLQFPAALTLYWTTASIFGIVNESIMRFLGRDHGNISERTTKSGT